MLKLTVLTSNILCKTKNVPGSLRTANVKTFSVLKESNTVNTYIQYKHTGLSIWIFVKYCPTHSSGFIHWGEFEDI